MWVGWMFLQKAKQLAEFPDPHNEQAQPPWKNWMGEDQV